jgi:MFS superfamily sulfate permease-like transporter
MITGTAQRITRIAVCATLAAALALLVLVLWSWLAEALSDPTVPIILVAVLLVTLASFIRPESH